MPVMDGITATLALRADARFASLPILAMTANAMQVDRDRCQAAGMNDFVIKPIEPDALWQALVQWIRPRAGLGATAPPTQHAKDRRATSDVALADVALRQPVPGLDITLGLRRVMGNQTLYVTLLRSFVAEQHDACDRIQAALTTAHRGETGGSHDSRGDWASAERAAHTLKGLAGNMGASGLQASADAVEAALRAHQPADDITFVLTPLRADLAALIEALKTALLPLVDTSDTQSSAATDPAEAAALLSTLQVLLDDDDPDAREYFITHSAVFKPHLGGFHAQISTALAQFDLGLARDLLREATAS